MICVSYAFPQQLSVVVLLFQMTRKDPVHSIPLKDYVLQQLRQCHNLFGDKAFDELTKQIDAQVYLQLQRFTSTWSKAMWQTVSVMCVGHVTEQVMWPKLYDRAGCVTEKLCYESYVI